MNFTKFALAIVATLTIAACGNKDVAFDTLETARKQARENAEYNARKWRAETKAFADANIVSRGDSSQNPTCPQGDGWASIDLTNANGQTYTKLKCSTVSDSVGCRDDRDFKSSPYANEDGSCQPVSKVPHPLPKIAK